MGRITKMAFARAGMITLAVLFWPAVVCAQIVDDIERRLPDAPAREIPQDPELPGELALPDQKPVSGEVSTFTLTAVSVRGATVFSARELAKDYASFLAREVSVADLAVIAEAITERYRRHGYFLSKAIVPPQNTAGGYVIIDVVEGYIGDVELVGAESARASRIVRKLIAPKTPAKLRDLERAILLVNDLRGVTITQSAMKVDPNDVASHALVLTLKSDRVEAILTTDNRGTEEAGPIQTFAQASLNSAVLSGDQFGGGIFSTPFDADELLFGQLFYSAPIGTSGLQAMAYGAMSRIDSGGYLAPYDVEGKTSQALVRLTYPLARRRSFSLWATGAFAFRRAEESILGANSYRDEVGSVSAGVYGAWRFAEGATTFNVEVTRGVGALSSNEAARHSRSNADAVFTRTRVDLARTQEITKDLQFYAALSGQYADGALLASEEFAYGGVRFGRAYDYGTLRGDRALAGSVEVRWRSKTPLQAFPTVQTFAFFDAAAAWNAAPLSYELDRGDASSAGAGFRLSVAKSARLTYEAARPIDGFTGEFSAERWRHFFAISVSF